MSQFRNLMMTSKKQNNNVYITNNGSEMYLSQASLFRIADYDKITVTLVLQHTSSSLSTYNGRLFGFSGENSYYIGSYDGTPSGMAGSNKSLYFLMSTASWSTYWTNMLQNAGIKYICEITADILNKQFLYTLTNANTQAIVTSSTRTMNSSISFSDMGTSRIDIGGVRGLANGYYLWMNGTSITRTKNGITETIFNGATSVSGKDYITTFPLVSDNGTS